MTFNLLTRSDFERCSALAITDHHELLSPKLGRTATQNCQTCNLDICVGHCGHIDLPFFVPHPIYHNMVPMILTCFCDKCGQVLRVREEVPSFKDYYRVITNSKFKSERNVCECATPTVKVYKYGWKSSSKPGCYEHNSPSYWIYVVPSGKTVIDRTELQEVRDKLAAITPEQMVAMRLSPTWRPEDLIVDYIMVMPPLLRPSARSTHGYDYATELYKRILDIVNGSKIVEEHQLKVFNYYVQLLGRSTEDSYKLFKRFISGKTGLIRSNLLGTRNNRAARTVITTNSYIPASHVGIPSAFKRSLTVFEYLSDINASKIATLISSGKVVSFGTFDAKQYLGTTSMEAAQKMDPLELVSRLRAVRTLAYVERELMDDDWVYINRQPTLQHTSIIAFRAKLVDVSTMEINLAVTKPFGADFDGDEMSIYVASDVESRAECMTLLASDKNIYSSADGGLLIQPIQDCVSALYRMTRDDPECSMTTFLRVVDTCLAGEYGVHTVCDGRWSTRNFLTRHNRIRGESTITSTTLISTLLPPSLLIRSRAFTVIEGILTATSAMQRSHLHALINVLHSRYSSEYTLWFISMIQLVADIWLKEYPLSVGYTDCWSIPEDVVDEVEKLYTNSFGRILDYEHRKTLYPDLSQHFEMQILTIIRGQIGAPARQMIKDYVTKHCRDNPFTIMIDSGARGDFTSVVNMMVRLGQQEVNGRQDPLYGTDEDERVHPINKGFVMEPYNVGLSRRGTYYQAASGRQGIVNTGSGVTDPGVMFRLLWSFLADAQVDYAGRVTNHDGRILSPL